MEIKSPLVMMQELSEKIDNLAIEIESIKKTVEKIDNDDGLLKEILKPKELAVKE